MLKIKEKKKEEVVTWGQIKGTRKVHQETGHLRPDPYQQPSPWTTEIKLPTKSSQVGHGFSGHRPAVAPFAWQSNKAILFYFTQNSVSELRFGVGFTEAEFLASRWRHKVCPAQSSLGWSSFPLDPTARSPPWQILASQRWDTARCFRHVQLLVPTVTTEKTAKMPVAGSLVEPEKWNVSCQWLQSQ